MDLIDHLLGAQDSTVRRGAVFSHGKDRFCFSRYLSGLHGDRKCTDCPHLVECRQKAEMNRQQATR